MVVGSIVSNSNKRNSSRMRLHRSLMNIFLLTGMVDELIIPARQHSTETVDEWTQAIVEVSLIKVFEFSGPLPYGSLLHIHLKNNKSWF